MNNCDFCDIVKFKDLELCQGVVLYEDDLLMVFPARGGIVRGYLMIIVKKHINGFPQLTDDELIHVKRVIASIKKLYKQYFDIDSILLEHGSTPGG